MRVLENGVYRESTSEELREFENAVSPEIQIEYLKQRLSETDYKAIKYAEGVLSETEYAQTKAVRQNWRDEINRLEKGREMNFQEEN